MERLSTQRLLLLWEKGNTEAESYLARRGITEVGRLSQRPHWFAFEKDGRYCEMLPDGTTFDSYTAWDKERTRRAPVYFNWFPQWREDREAHETLPAYAGRPLFRTLEGECNYLLANGAGGESLSQLRADLSAHVSRALARFPYYGADDVPQAKPAAAPMLLGKVVWKRGLVSHPRWNVMQHLAPPACIYTYEAFYDGARAMLADARRADVVSFLCDTLRLFADPTAAPPLSGTDDRLIMLRQIAAFARALREDGTASCLGSLFNGAGWLS